MNFSSELYKMEFFIQKLNSSNYASWAEAMQVYMIDRGVWEFVEKPEVITPDDLAGKELRNVELRRN